MFNIYNQLWLILLPKERKTAFYLLIIILFQALLELVSVTSIFPVFSVLSDPKLIQNNYFFRFIYEFFSFTDINYFLIFLSVFSFLIISLRTFISFGTNYLISRFVRIRSHLISSRLLVSYVNEPYAFFLDKHSAEMSKTILSEVEQVVGGCLLPALQLIAQLSISLSIVLAVIFINPIITFVPLLIIFIMYGGIIYFVRYNTETIGEERSFYNSVRFRIAQELFAGIKEVKLSNKEKFYFNEFKSSSLNYSKLFIKLGLLRDSPRYLLELISIGAFFSIIIILLFTSSGGISKILPTISVFAYAGIRVLPAFQKLYQHYISMKFNYTALKSLKNDLLKSNLLKEKRSSEILLPKKNIQIKNVDYFYPKSKIAALNKINLNIKVNTTVGIVGSTGSGKSTLLDIIIGLLEPSKGQVFIDNNPLSKDNKNAWHNAIGYVSQDIFISDDSIKKNIALGINEDEIDLEKLKRAAKNANILDFVMNELPNKFDTKLGERGIRVSGGQKQRIGIARAFYQDPPILILDEATSSLDNQTEKNIIDSLNNLTRKKTIIMIAHRLTTVKDCDKIYFIEKGRMISEGKYEELIKTKEFQKFASV